LKTFTGFSGEDDNSSDAGLTKEERKEKYRYIAEIFAMPQIIKV